MRKRKQPSDFTKGKSIVEENAPKPGDPDYVSKDFPELQPGELGYMSPEERERRMARYQEEAKRLKARREWEEKKDPYYAWPNYPPIHAIDGIKEYGEMLAAWRSYLAEPVDGCYPDAYIPYLQKLFKPGDTICIMWIHSTEQWKPGQFKTGQSINTVEEMIKADSQSALAALQAQGWNLYVNMNPLIAGSFQRKKDRVSEIRSVYCEVDENGSAVREEINKAVAAGEIPKPHVVIESSPGKFQFIWFVEGFSATAQQERMNSSLQVRFGTDPASVDCVRLLRLPGFMNLKPKYAPDFPVSHIVERTDAPRYRPEDFKVKIVDPVRKETDREPIASEEINKIVNFLADALNEACVEFGDIKNLPSGAVQIHLIECPWGDEHSDNKRGDADVFVNSDGSLGFYCFHSHCAARDWAAFREELERLAGHKLKFGESGIRPLIGESVSVEEYKKMLENMPAEGMQVEPPVAKSESAQPTVPTQTTETEPPAPAESAPAEPTETNLNFEQAKPATVTSNTPVIDLSIQEKVPPYDSRLIRGGIFAEAVDLIAGGTTMPVQFPHLVAKAICGLRWAVEGIQLEGCDAEPRLYALNIGKTGTGKGWSMKRGRELFTKWREDTDSQRAQKIKIWDGTDSGAGLKDSFFDQPSDAGVLLYIDETMELGQKARADRNPVSARTVPPTSAFPRTEAGRLLHCRFRGLLSVYTRYGLHARQVA